MADRPGRVLVVDDNKVNRLLLARTLELQGHHVESAENGRLALTRLSADDFDLVLLDIEMPEVDGFEVLAGLKQDRALRDIPVIVTSSLEGLDNVVRCLELGAEDYLAKPVNAALLKARLDASLEKKRLRDQQAEIVRRFAAPAVAEDLAQSGFALGGRRVEVTVLFVDIRDFTTMAEQMRPEDTIDLLNDYYALMFDAITSNGGVVNQMMGDGLMAVFGAPQPLEDGAVGAVVAAREMVDVMALLSAGRTQAGDTAVRVGVGVATGEVIAGYTGTRHRASYTCIGDTVNLGARLEEYTKEAERSIVVDGATATAVGDAVPLDALGSVVMRGKTSPTELFAVSGY
jgi:class 3 adenylate cyclase